MLKLSVPVNVGLHRVRKMFRYVSPLPLPVADHYFQTSFIDRLTSKVLDNKISHHTSSASLHYLVKYKRQTNSNNLKHNIAIYDVSQTNLATSCIGGDLSLLVITHLLLSLVNLQVRKLIGLCAEALSC